MSADRSRSGMSSLKGSRTIPLGSKEAKSLLGQSGLSILYHNDTTHKSSAAAEVEPEDVDLGVRNQPSAQSQREGEQLLYCQCCCVSLGDREEQLVHYRLDWHRYNLKRRLKGLASLSQEEFERLTGSDLSSISGSESDSDPSKNSEEEKEEDDDSSCSKRVGSPFVYFFTADGQYYAVYRSLLTHLRAADVRTTANFDLVSSLTSLAQPLVCIILMRAGGHFAGAVFKGSTMTAHKTFHRYTVRAKRGTAQSARDGHQGGHAPRSAGASLRRYNESALVGEIRELIASWSNYVDEASVIFIRTPKYGKGVFIGDAGGTGGGGNAPPFSKHDPRIRNIPFATRRPTIKEVQCVYSKLAAIYKVSEDHSAQQGSVCSPKVKPLKPVKKTVEERAMDTVSPDEVGGLNDVPPPDSSDDEAEKEETVGGASEKTDRRKKRRRAKKATAVAEIPLPVQQLLKLCGGEGSNDCESAVTKLLQEMRLPPVTTTTIIESKGVAQAQPSQLKATAVVDGEEVDNQIQEEIPVNLKEDPSYNVLNDTWNGETMLHVAAASGKSSLIPVLLLHGANPAIKNKAGSMAYSVAKDKSVRDAFRRFMAQHPGRYDYSAAKIPSPLTEDMERERKEKMTEKKKAMKKAKKQREKERKSEMELEQLKLDQEKAVAGLSEREKRAMAAEKRMSTQLPTSSAVLKAGLCSFCESTLAGLVPFEKLQYKYCSMDCLKQHRKQLA